MQELSRKGYVSKPPLPEVREANRLRQQSEKKRKDAVKETAARKRERREKHDKECARRKREGLSPLTTLESTEEKDSLPSGVHFSESDDFEVVTAGSPPPVPQRAGVEASASVLCERRLMPAVLGKAPTPGRTEGCPCQRRDGMRPRRRRAGNHLRHRAG